MSISAGLINRAKKFRQRALAEKCGLGTGTISQLLSGKNSNPCMKTVAKFKEGVRAIEEERLLLKRKETTGKTERSGQTISDKGAPKTKSRKNPANKQSLSRDAAAGDVRGKSA